MLFVSLLKKYRKDKKKIELIKPYFDERFYLESYPEVNKTEKSAIRHYLKEGWKQGKDPSPDFSTDFYLCDNEDVHQAGINPLLHYAVYGVKEGRSTKAPHRHKPEVDVAKETTAEFLDEHPYASEARLIKGSGHFDEGHYLSENPDVKKAGLDPVLHYIEFGEREGRRPNPNFDPDFYLNIYADVRSASLSPLIHFITHGAYEGRIGFAQHTKNIDLGLKPVLFVGHDAEHAGSEVVLLEIVRWFALHTCRKIKVLLLAPGVLSGEYAKYAEVYTATSLDDLDSPSAGQFLDDMFDMVYLNTVVSGKAIDFLRSHKSCRQAKFVAHIHEMAKVLKTFEDELQQLKSAVGTWISASPATTHDLVSLFGIEAATIHTVEAFIRPLASSDQEIADARSQARNELGIPESARVIGGCGTVYWRKGADIFTQVAKNVLEQDGSSETVFFWIGDGEDRATLQEQIRTWELEDRILFIGSHPNANELIAAADIFFLSSREDPFPLVCLEAAQYAIPTVCFGEATGIKIFVEDDAGVVIPTIRVSEAASTIRQLEKHPEIIRKKGESARRKLISRYVSDIQIPKIFNCLQSQCGLAPSVSVIVPNYNHEQYLPERINSILNQSIKDIEVIVLDDCSTDDSMQVITSYKKDSRIKIFPNESNTGIPFLQWKKGTDFSEADLVWIAESDDSCDENFLETLLPAFQDELVNIAYSRTEIINTEGELVPDALTPYLERAHPVKFRSPYLQDGIQEAEGALSRMCTLVNASGIIMRKAPLQKALPHALDFKMCGDWLIYLQMLKNGKIAYNPGTNNYFRRHATSVVHKIEGKPEYFTERARISEYVVRNYPISVPALRRMFAEIDHEWERFHDRCSGYKLSDLYPKDKLKSIWSENRENSLNIGIYVHGMAFSKGGIERLASDLANRLATRGHKVTIYCKAWGSSSAPVYSLMESVRFAAIFDEQHMPQSAARFRELLLGHQIDVFIPMLSEWLFEPIIDIAHSTGIPIIASEHNDPGKITELWWDKEARAATFRKADKIHLLLDSFRSSLPNELQNRIEVIPNGFILDDYRVQQKANEARQKRIISVGRLAPQKRMDLLITAFSEISDEYPDWRLDIYGEGQLQNELDELIDSLGLQSRISLCGNTSDIAKEYTESSIFVLPSDFEGFGIVILEARAAGLPCIAYADCNGPNQLINNGVNGLLVERGDDEIHSLSNALKELMSNDNFRHEMASHAPIGLEPYDIEAITEQWNKLITKTAINSI